MYRFHTSGRRAREGHAHGLPRRAVRLGVGRHRGGDDARSMVIGPDRRSCPCCAARRSSTSAPTSPMPSGITGKRPATMASCWDAGAEILLETARFWVSRAQPEADGRCHIRGVIGPDEYHETIDDNAFTNVMARWNIRRGLDAAALLRQRWPERWAGLSGTLGLDEAELADWADAADTNGDRARSAHRAVSSSSPGSSGWNPSTWRATPDGRCRWTWCSGGSGPSWRRSSSRRTSSHSWPCCRRSLPAMRGG